MVANMVAKRREVLGKSTGVRDFGAEASWTKVAANMAARGAGFVFIWVELLQSGIM